MSGSRLPRWGCSLVLVGYAIAAVVGLNVAWQLLSHDEDEAADHFLQVVREVVPRQRTIDLACDEGSSWPQVVFHAAPMVVRSRLQPSEWRREKNGWYRREFDGWTADLELGLDGPTRGAITVTEDYDLDCGDLLRGLRGHEFRVRRT